MINKCNCGGKMRPHEKKETSFSWKCPNCGHVVTQRKRVPGREKLEIRCIAYLFELSCRTEPISPVEITSFLKANEIKKV